MKTKQSDERQAGCFAWCVRIKKSVNERWARARNALVQRFRRDNKVSISLSPEDLLNETGCPDMVVTKVTVSPPQSPAVGHEERARAIVSVDKPTVIACDIDGEPDLQQLGLFVASMMNEARTELVKEMESGHILVQTVTNDQDVDMDNISLTSSVVSEMAVKAVNASLTNIVNDITAEETRSVDETCSMSSGELSVIADAVVSASLSIIMSEENGVTKFGEVTESRTRTVTEMLETCNIDPAIGHIKDGSDGLPPYSP